MSTIAAKDVMALREKTGLGMMDCKKALQENNGDMAAAESWLREKRKGKMDTRTERTTGEGRIGIAIDGPKAVIIELRTETDFTAKNDAFLTATDSVAGLALGQAAGDVEADDAINKHVDDLRITTGENVNFARGMRLDGGSYGSYIHHDGKRACLLQIEGDAPADALKGICQHIVFHDPMGIDADDVPAEKIESIRTAALAEAKESGKNDEIAGKMADGKVRKYLEENTLMAQKYVLDESMTVGDALGGDAKITAFIRYTLGG
ncbi:MAG: translation elongation factor Ts [Planctomycetota bacterium]|nr:translation elongation factor Ts [Planctomycetota bacterium]|tara:strand:- start:7840 stop:8631 length:792 start_codon:yes stop_codon:yes gene_type:complete